MTERVDLLVTGGRVVTVDAHDTVVEDGAVAIHGGRIVAVGPSAAVTADYDAATSVDAGGAMVLPGMINAHTHLAMTLFRGVADDIDLQGFLDRVWARERATISRETIRLGVTAGIAESLASGVTTAADMYFHHDVSLDAAEEIGFRLVTGPAFFEFEMPWYRGFDAEFEAAGAWLSKDPGLALRFAVSAHSTYTLEPAHLKAVAEVAVAHGALLHTHASENRGEVEGVRARHGASPIGVLEQCGALRPGTILAHAVVLDDEDHATLAASGAGVAHCPASNLKLASGIAPVPRYLNDGVPVGLGTDGPASSNSLDLFTAMRLAALIHKVEADDPRVVTAREVVRMATIDGARVLGIDDHVGSIEVGKCADLVILDHARTTSGSAGDPYSYLAYAASSRDVRDVFVDGRHVLAGAELLTIDEASIAGQLRNIATA